MKYKFIRILCFTLLAAGIAALHPGMKSTTEKSVCAADILDISYTPDTLHRCYGWFTDAGSIDGLHAARTANNGSTALRPLQPRYVPPPVDGTQSAAVVSFAKDTQEIFVRIPLAITPARLYMSAHSTHGSITQRLNFTVPVPRPPCCASEADTAEDLLLSGSQWGKDITRQRRTELRHRPSSQWRNRDRDLYPNVELAKTDNNLQPLVRSPRYPVNVAISFFTSEKR